MVTVEPITIGEHLKRRRLQLHILQIEAAKQLGVHLGSIQNWEQGLFQPAEASIPRIIAWLGYDPRVRSGIGVTL